MTVRETMDSLLQKNPSLIDCGEFKLDYRPYGFLQNPNKPEITSVYESKDDIDNEGSPLTKIMVYDNLKEFLQDFPPTY
jgi:hypothetical protein